MADSTGGVEPMNEFVDDRGDTLDDFVDNPDAFDKLGDPDFGRRDPGRCHVCLAWVRFPYNDNTLTICPDCHKKNHAEREAMRDRVREALREVWRAPT